MSDEFKIEKNIPVPEGSNTWVKYPFAKMEIGDSIFGVGRVRIAAVAWGKYHGKKFKSRKEGDGIRVWRIA